MEVLALMLSLSLVTSGLVPDAAALSDIVSLQKQVFVWI
jgi:hypothetical protein